MAYVGEMQYLTIGSNTYSLPSGGGGGGSVTSVGVSNATNGGLTVSGTNPVTSSGTITIGHSNVLTSAQSTQAVYPITIDKNGHIASYGSAVSIDDEIFITEAYDTSYADTRAAFNAGKYLICLDAENGIYAPLAYETTTDFTFTVLDSSFVSGYGGHEYILNSSGWTVSGTAFPDEKLKTASATSGTTYYPVIGNDSTSAETKYYDKKGLSYVSTQGSSNMSGSAVLTLGTSANSGSANGRYGQLNIYSETGKKASIYTAGSMSADRTFALPNNSGTIALTSDIPDVSGKIDTAGTGLSKSGTTLNHSNSVTAQTTQAVYPVTIDAEGHIASYGSAVTIPTVPTITLNGSSTTSPSFYAPTGAGTNGYVLTSSGSGAPSWTSGELTDEKIKPVSGVTNSQAYGVLLSYDTVAQKPRTADLKYYQASSYAEIAVGSTSRKGQLTLQDTSGKNVIIKPTTLTDFRTITLPDASGTIALTSDIPDVSGKIDTAGTGLSKSGTTLNHSNSITAGTIGSSSASQGSTIAIPYATYDSNGHITGKGTHTHTITGFLTAETDPIFAASAAAGITSTDISNWNNKLSGSSVNTNSYMIIGDWRFEWGTISLTTTNASGSGSYTAPYYIDGTVTFDMSFTTNPYVYCVVNGAWTGTRVANTYDISTTGCKIRLYASHKNSTSTGIRWLAIGRYR